MIVRRSRTLGLLLLAVFALSALASSPVSAFRSRQIRGILFAAASRPTSQFRAADPTVVRSRFVTVDITALEAARPTEPAAIAPPSVLVNLFDDLAYTAVVDRVDPAVGGYTWVGHIPGIALSTVTLATVDGVVSGGIVMPEAAYVIRYAGAGVHEVAQIDQSKFLSEADPIGVSQRVAGLAAVPPDPSVTGDSGSSIDVMVLYTPAAAAEVGGTSVISAMINQGIADANTSYINSGITQRLRLVNSQQVAYTEATYNASDANNTGMHKDLYNLTDGVNGLEGVAALRNASSADLVQLITRRATDYCGIAWMMAQVDKSFEANAFSVVSQNCISAYTTAHELGHNMGAQHDWYVNNSTTPYTFAHGYIDSANRFRTVMAYNNACSVQGFNCTRLLYWSNPGLNSPSANGNAPMGIPQGTKSDCPTGAFSNMACDADDHLTLNNTALTIANFRQSVALTVAPSITTQPSDVTVAAGATVTFSAAASGSPTPTVQWQVSTNGGSTFSNIAGATATTYAFTATSGQNYYRFRAVFTNSAGSVATNSATNGATLKISGQLVINPSSLVFSATKAATPGSSIVFVTPAQIVSVTNLSTAWTATSAQQWLQVTGGSGTGAGQFTVAIVNPGDVIGASPSLSGTITIASTAAPVTSVSIPVTLTIYRPGTTGAPFGAFDTPVDGTTGMQGSFAVTGWALDDVAIDRVEIWRDPVAGENTPTYYGPGQPGNGKIFIANPLFIPGSRPDVEAAYSGYPQSNRSGWGYLLLSWGLWGQGNGTYKLYAFAYDKEGNAATLGSKSITVDNAHATKPFGALDTPTYGATVSGGFWNYGWALTPTALPPCTITNGNVTMSIDSVPQVAVNYGDVRTDIAAGFAGFTNGANSGGAYFVDTSALSNGIHQIGWLVYDSCGRGDGIGSRFFTVLNGAASPAADAIAVSARPLSTSSAPILVRQGGVAWQSAWPNRDGTRVVDVAQDGRIEVKLPASPSGTYGGYQLAGSERRPLPAGSSLDAASGVFYWQPAAGFLGGFDLLFVAPNRSMVPVRVVVGPPVRMSVDTPTADETVSAPFTVAGWAVDLASEDGAGIDTVHMWAYPLDGSAPIWLGVAEHGDRRPDVGKLYGVAFTNSSYSLEVGGLAPGAYDLVVYPHRARTNAFEGAQIVRVTVR